MQGLLEGKWKTRADTLHLDEHEASQRLAGLLNAVRIVLVARSSRTEDREAFLRTTNRYWVGHLLEWTQGVATDELTRWFEQLLRFDILVRTFRMTEPEALEQFAFSVMH